MKLTSWMYVAGLLLLSWLASAHHQSPDTAIFISAAFIILALSPEKRAPVSPSHSVPEHPTANTTTPSSTE